MPNETKIGQLVIDLKIKTEALEKGFETAKKKIQEMEQQSESLKNSNKGLDASFIAMSAGIVASLHKINGIIMESVEEYKSYTQAMSALSDVADYTGNNLNDMGKMMNKYSKYMTKGDLAATIKNFSLMNMTMEQQEQIIGDLINSAIKNRNANYDVSTAVKVASDGYKQGLSTLSDSAGVTENLSVMLDNYAKSIGKTASQLTEMEQNQAYVNRTMEAAAPFTGAMEEYLDTLASKQGEYSQALRETQVAYAEAIEPILVEFIEFKTKILSGLTEWISKNQTATSAITAFIITLGTLSATILVMKKVYDLYTKSIITAKVAQGEFNIISKATSFSSIATTATLAISAIAGVTAAIVEQKQKIEETAKAQKLHNEVLCAMADLNNSTVVSSIKDTRDALQEFIDLRKKYDDNEAFITTWEKILDDGKLSEEAAKLAKEAVEDAISENLTLAFAVTTACDKVKEKIGLNQKDALTTIDATKYLKSYNKRLEEVTALEEIKAAMETEKVKNQQKEAAQLKVNANQMQNYLNIIKKGDKTSTEYANAEKELSKAYSEASTAAGINTDVAQKCIDIDQARADQAWNTSQEMIQGNIQVIQSFMGLAEAAVNDEKAQIELANAIGIEYSKIIPTLNSVLSILQLIGGYTPESVPNITPTTVSAPKRSSGGSSSYSNKKLDNYKKEIEHKKAMDQISLRQEISMYEYALKAYAKTADEKMELREKIYSLNKELAQKEKEMLEQQTEDYETYIQQQKNLRGSAYDVTEQTRDYDKIIQMHKNYLNQIMKDERLSLDERKEIHREELSTIRDYEQQKRDLRVENIDNTVTHLTNAITKQLEEMQEKDKEIIDKNLEEIEKWKEARIKAINDEYDARIEAINKELEALDKAEQQKTRDEEDAEYEKKKKRLEDLIAFEHDITTKANYQKELDKLLAEYQKTLDKRALDDKKEALNEQKELLEEEQNNKVQTIENEAEKQKEIYEKQLTDLEKYYSEQIDMAQETAEKMLLNVENNQDKILDLLKSYGNAYEITGQTLGEKLAQGINEGIANKIQNVIQRIQDTIDAGIENKLAQLSSSVYRYEAGNNKPQTTSINITQQNYIEQNPEMPSETFRKLNNVSEDLAAQLRTEIG